MGFKNKRNTFKHKKQKKQLAAKHTKTSVDFKVVNKYALSIFIFSILIYFIFYINPKDAWVAFNGKFRMMQLTGNVFGKLNARIDSIDVPDGFVSNFQPIIFEYDNKSIELKEDELKIEFHKTYNDYLGNTLEFANNVNFYSRNSFISTELSIRNKSVKVNGGDIYAGIQANLNDKDTEQFESISWELSGNDGIEINTQNHIDYTIYIKGVRLEKKELQRQNIKIKSTFQDPYIRLYVDTNKPVYFDIKGSNDLSYSGRADNILLFTSTNASLTFINSATPQVLQAPLTSVSIRRIKFEPNYKNNDEYLNAMKNVGNQIRNDFTLQIGDNSIKSNEISEDFLDCLISGRVDDVSLSGKSLFPSFIQWVRYNSNTITTILVTSFISLMFALITRKE